MSKKVTVLNVDDIIREEKRKLVEQGKSPRDYLIAWGENEFSTLRFFKRLNGFSDIANGGKFFGMKHYRDPTIKGYITRILDTH